MNDNTEAKASRSDSRSLRVTAVQQVPQVWSDCGWVAEISRISERSGTRHRAAGCDLTEVDEGVRAASQIFKVHVDKEQEIKRQIEGGMNTKPKAFFPDSRLLPYSMRGGINTSRA